MTTIKRLNELFRYNPKTGQLIRRVTVSSNAKEGDIAGTIQGAEYFEVGIDGTRHYCHTVIWAMTHNMWPKKQIDHVDQNGRNNKLDNLREVTQAEQEQNKPLRQDNTSNVTGVSWDKGKNKWQAYINKNSKRNHLGFFTTFIEAVKARNEIEKKFGWLSGKNSPAAKYIEENFNW